MLGQRRGRRNSITLTLGRLNPFNAASGNEILSISGYESVSDSYPDVNKILNTRKKIT